MRPELSAKAICVDALQYSGDAALVSTHELDNPADGGGLQCYCGVPAAATVSLWDTWAAIPRVDVV